MGLLKFGLGNAKVGKEIYTFSLPAGYSCPGALHCLARADRKTGKITDGKQQEFRCFAASMEWRPSIRNARWHNFELLKGKSTKEMTALILASLPSKAKIVRVHVSGDYFSDDYFKAWINVANAKPDMLFYSYTKSINVWIANRDDVPSNLKLTASYGGKFDSLIEEFELKSAVVVKLDDIEFIGLPVDHDDSHAYAGNESFALLIHGTQPRV